MNIINKTNNINLDTDITNQISKELNLNLNDRLEDKYVIPLFCLNWYDGPNTGVLSYKESLYFFKWYQDFQYNESDIFVYKIYKPTTSQRIMMITSWRINELIGCNSYRFSNFQLCNKIYKKNIENYNEFKPWYKFFENQFGNDYFYHFGITETQYFGWTDERLFVRNRIMYHE